MTDQALLDPELSEIIDQTAAEVRLGVLRTATKRMAWTCNYLESSGVASELSVPDEIRLILELQARHKNLTAGDASSS